MVPGFSGQKMLLKSNPSLASSSYTKMETEPEKECSTGGWWRWPWPPCPAPPLFALWVRPTSSPSWQSERGSAQPLGLPIVPGCQFMIQYKLQQRGSGNTVKLLSGKSPPMSKSLFSCLSGFKNGLILPTGQWYAPSAVNNDAWYCMVLHGIALYCMVLHGIAWFYMVLHYLAWYCIVLHGIAWYCLLLHDISWY